MGSNICNAFIETLTRYIFLHYSMYYQEMQKKEYIWFLTKISHTFNRRTADIRDIRALHLFSTYVDCKSERAKMYKVYATEDKISLHFAIQTKGPLIS